MFRILEKMRFYTADNIRSKMKEVHGIVTRGLVQIVEKGKLKRSDILVSYLDNIGKSGAYYAKLYADENDIYFENIVERPQLLAALEKKRELGAVVFIDDFIGTGNSAAGYFSELAKHRIDILLNPTLRMFFVAICGFQSAKANVENAIAELGLPVIVRLCDPLDETEMCFSEVSRIFPDIEQRGKAKAIAYQHGIGLVKDAPLGYGDCQAPIVFENSCPNNTLPILWAETKGWFPLFKRL